MARRRRAEPAVPATRGGLGQHTWGCRARPGRASGKVPVKDPFIPSPRLLGVAWVNTKSVA